MKIGILADAASKHTKRWANGLGEFGHKVVVLHPGKSSKLQVSNFQQNKNVKLINVPQPLGLNFITRGLRFVLRKLIGDRFLNQMLAKKIEKVAKEEDLEVIWVHGMQFHGQVAGFITDIPKVIMLAGSDIYRKKEDRNTIKEYQQAFHSADIIQSQSNAIIGKAKQDFYFNDQKVHVFPWGIDFRRYALEKVRNDELKIREKLGIKENSFIIFSCRSMRPLYNWKNILEGFSQIKDQQVHLIMIKGLGTTKELKEADQIITECGMEDKVTLIREFIPFEEMIQLYTIADATISIPDSDNLSDVIWETMAFRCIPILARVPAYFEALDQDHAIYLQDRTPKSIAEGILQAMKKGWEGILDENYQKSLSNSWEETVNKQVLVFQEAIRIFSEKKK